MLAPVLPSLAHLLAPPPPPLQDARAERYRRLRAAHALPTATRPAVLVLDDVHWADPSTGEFLRLLVTNLPRTCRSSSRVAMTCPQRRSASPGLVALRHTYPRNPPGSAHPTRDRNAAAQLMGASTVPEHVAQRLHRRTAGIPFAIEEVIRLVVENDAGTSGNGEIIEGAGLPAPVRRVFLERLAALSEPARDIVAAAAVAGRPVTIDLLPDITGLSESETRRAVTLALDHGALYPASAGHPRLPPLPCPPGSLRSDL